jgi:hypothetical protein
MGAARGRLLWCSCADNTKPYRNAGFQLTTSFGGRDALGRRSTPLANKCELWGQVTPAQADCPKVGFLLPGDCAPPKAARGAMDVFIYDDGHCPGATA